MPIYERDDRFRVTAYVASKQRERSIHKSRGTRQDAEELEQRLAAGTVPVGATRKRPSRQSYVYFVQSGQKGPIKVGYTTQEPRDRLYAMQTGNPERLNMLAAIPGGPELESAMHVAFAGYHIEGEWFRYEGDVKRVVDELAAHPFCDGLQKLWPASEKAAKAVRR